MCVHVHVFWGACGRVCMCVHVCVWKTKDIPGIVFQKLSTFVFELEFLTGLELTK